MGDVSDLMDSLERRDAVRNDRVERYRRMVEIRLVEDRVLELYAEGHIVGSTHTCQGQEAVSMGLATAARPSDPIMCTYRGHGLALASGVTPEAVLGEILNKTLGAIQGLGGSMHLCDPSVGLFPTFAIVGAGIPVAAGAGLTAQVLGRDDVGIACFGDGAVNIGAFHEGLNLASVWELPVVFVCENNLYGEYTRIDHTTPIDDIASRADAYGMPGIIVDGQDVDVVEAAVSSALDKARAGGGPTLLEMKTYRYAGHSRGDAGTYRPVGELEDWQGRDPVTIFGQRLIDEGLLTNSAIEDIERETASEIEQAVERVLAAPRPGIEEMFRHVVAP